MKVSYKWLQDYIRIDLTPAELADRLTMAGLEVEEVKPLLNEFKGIIVGRVRSVKKHPHADRLSVCVVNTGKEDLQVICGAANVAENQKIAFAPVGTELPNKLKIKKAKIREIDSFGMICSEEELGLAEKSEGIWVLDDDLPLGKDLFALMEKNQDYVLDISITPNRPDAMSMIGIAREISALTAVPYKLPRIKKAEQGETAAGLITVQIKNPQGCPRYAARVIKNVKIGPSPKWMSDRLKAGGIRPINNVVDITNFVLLELGQPLHAFDLNRISGAKIIVRDSRKEESFTTLDEKERLLPAQTVMICDAKKPVAIGGIMGGLNSEVSDRTTDILLESAYFNPVRISASSKSLGLSSEASQRFERGVDPQGIPFACDRAAFLMAELAGGQVLKGIVDEYPEKIEARKIRLRPERVNHLLGTNLSEKKISGILKGLGISYNQKKAIVPTFRPDIDREVDLIEEVARQTGFDNIPLKAQSTIEYDVRQNPNEMFYQLVRSEARELGFYEVITNSMVAYSEVQAIGEGPYVRILNPISDDMNVMRRSLLPGLLKVICYNINRNAPDLHIFEMGRVFHDSNPEKSGVQPYYISGLIHGKRRRPNWSDSGEDVDFYDVKGIVEAFFSKIFLDNIEFILYDKTVYFDRRQVMAIRSSGDIIGSFGRIDGTITKRFEIDSDVYGYEFSVEVIKKHIHLDRLFEIFSRYPFVEKDLAFVVDEQLPAGDIKSLIFESGRPLVKNVSIFDLYKGDKLGNSKKSIAFRIHFQSPDRTLNEKEVSKIFNKIIRDAEKKFNAKLRD